MIVSEFIARVRYYIEDKNSLLYDPAEVLAALNEAKDEVLSLIRIFTDAFPNAAISFDFAVGETAKTTTVDILKILKVYSYDSNGYERSHTIKPTQFAHEFNLDYPEDIQYSRTSNGTYTFGRRNSEEALTLIINYVPNVADFLNSLTDINFGPPPTNNLIINKAALILLDSRKRTESARRLEPRIAKLEMQLQENLATFSNAGPRYVHYVG